MREKQMKINAAGKLSRVFISQFQLTILLIFLIISVGVVGLISLPKESLPEIVFPAITVQTVYPGASPEDIENLVTEKIENKLKDFDDVDSIESDSSFGISAVKVTFVEGVDIERKKIEVDNSLRELEFPEGVQTPKSIIFKTSEIPLMNISVSGDYSIPELTNIAEDIQDEIESVAGVDSVTLFGDAKSEISIVTDEAKMLTYGVTMNQLKTALKSADVSLPVGDLELNGVNYTLRVDETLDTVAAIKKVIVSGTNGSKVQVSDIAEVSMGIEDNQLINKSYIRSGESNSQNSIFLTVSRKVGSDVIGTADRIDSILSAEGGKLYPDDVTVHVSNNMAENVKADLGNIQSSAFSGLIVVVIVLFLFIGIRESLIVSITIPLSLLGTLGLLNLFGITFNTFAILGLIVALGLLVDNSIIVMENIDRMKRQGLSSREAALYGTNQVGYPIVSSTMTTLAAFFPLVILPGILGAFVSTIPLTIMITLTVSLFVSLTITPSIASKILNIESGKNTKKNGFKNFMALFGVALLSYIAFRNSESKWLVVVMTLLFTALLGVKIFAGDFGEMKLTTGYTNLIGGVVKKTRYGVLVIVLGIGLLLSSVSMFGTGLIKVAFFPKSEPNGLEITIDTPGGTTLEENRVLAENAEKILMEDPAVKSYNVTIGGKEVDLVTFTVALDTDTESGFTVLDRLQSELNQLTGGKIVVNGIATGPPVGRPIEVKVRGANLETLLESSKAIEAHLTKMSGVYNIESSVTTGVPQIVVDIDTLKATSLDLTPLDITSQLRGEVSGVEATTLKMDGEEVSVMIRPEKESISDMNRLKSLFIATPVGMMIPVQSVADIRIEPGISNISREDGLRVVTISADLRAGVNSGDITKALESAFSEDALPSGVTLGFAGDSEGISENFGYLFQSMILAVFLVFIILTVQFKSVIQPFVILSTIPMAAIGVIWGLILTSNDFGFYAFMGLVALVGIAVNDAIVLIDYMNFLRADGMSLREAVREAGKTRFNPVLATTLTTISGVLPLAFKEAYYAQFSFSLIFGLMMTTLMTLLFIPTIYFLIENAIEKRKGVDVNV